METLTVSKWGNGQGIRIPQAILNLLSIGIGTQLKLEISDESLILTPCKTDKPATLSDLFKNYEGPSYEELFKDDEVTALLNTESVGHEIL